MGIVPLCLGCVWPRVQVVLWQQSLLQFAVLSRLSSFGSWTLGDLPCPVSQDRLASEVFHHSLARGKLSGCHNSSIVVAPECLHASMVVPHCLQAGCPSLTLSSPCERLTLHEAS
jgi:hypothetical protein